MSFGTTDNNNYQTGGYGGGKSSGQQPLYKSITNELNQSASQMPGLQGQLASIVTKNAGNLVDAAYSGGPPRLDLSGLFKDAGNQVANTIGGSQQTPQQKVAESRAGGGILKMRQPPQPFNPNPTPNPGFGGGKGLIQPIGGQPGFGGGKIGLPVERGSFDPQPGGGKIGLPVERGSFDPTLPPGAEYGLFSDRMNQVPTKQYNNPQPVPMMKNFRG